MGTIVATEFITTKLEVDRFHQVPAVAVARHRQDDRSGAWSRPSCGCGRCGRTPNHARPVAHVVIDANNPSPPSIAIPDASASASSASTCASSSLPAKRCAASAGSTRVLRRVRRKRDS